LVLVLVFGVVEPCQVLGSGGKAPRDGWW